MGSDNWAVTGREQRCYFNPRSPHGERPMTLYRLRIEAAFQSTLPAWGATYSYLKGAYTMTISIHAPRMGSDFKSCAYVARYVTFQSTLPAWGATFVFLPVVNMVTISIHAPRMGSDDLLRMPEKEKKYFNPRSPHGERRRDAHCEG
mgnify:CR=1 FL=1